MSQVEGKKLQIHVDLANFTPSIDNYFNFWTYLNSLDELCRIISIIPEMNFREIEKILYFEGYTKDINIEELIQTSKKQPEESRLSGLGHFLKRFRNLFISLYENFGREISGMKPVTYIASIFRMRGYRIFYAPKEAEQMIPDTILDKPDFYHAIVTDDMARDTTPCLVRVIREKSRVNYLRGLKKAKHVISLEHLSETNYLLCWLLKKIQGQSVDICSSIKQDFIYEEFMDFSEMNISEDFENFTTNDLRRFLIFLINSDKDFLGKFLIVVNPEERMRDFLQAVTTKLRSEKSLLMSLWGRLRNDENILNFFSIREIDQFFSNLVTDERIFEIIRLEQDLEMKNIDYQSILNIKGSPNELKSEIKELEKKINEIERLSQEVQSKKEELKELEKHRDNLLTQKEFLTRELSKILEEVELMTKEFREKDELIKQKKEEQRKLKEQIEGKKSELDDLRKSVEILIKEEQNIESEYEKLRKYERLKIMKEEIEKYRRNVGEYERVLSIGEKYEEVKDKFDTLKNEFNKLLKAYFEGL